MNKMYWRAALLSCAALAVTPAIANHSWGGYHWARSSNPLQLRVERQLTSKWVSAFNVAIADWDQSTVLSLAGASANLGVNSRKCTAVAGKALVCNDHYGQRGWLGIATIWPDSQGHITKATTKLNDSYFDSSTYNTPAWIALVACQEIGHDFGLGHQDEAFGPPNLGTCMDYTNDPDGGGDYGPANEHPNKHDYDELELIYSHLDSYGTASSAAATNFGIRAVGARPAAPSASDNEAGDSPEEWGLAVHRDGQGRPDLFVKNLAKGKKVTHVFWAPGEERGHHD